MLKIFICEDDKKQLDIISSAIRNTILIEDYDMEIVLETQDPHELAREIKLIDCCGVYFLDVDLKNTINGIELSEVIRKQDPRGFIIFITTHDEMRPLTFEYKVEALDYIIKDNFNCLARRISECLMNIHEKYSKALHDMVKVLHINTSDRVIHVEFDKILFFETAQVAHKVILHAIDRQIEFYGHLKDIKKDLDERFYQCHKSYIVNKEKIKEVDKKNRIINLVNDQECLVSVRAIKGIYK